MATDLMSAVMLYDRTNQLLNQYILAIRPGLLRLCGNFSLTSLQLPTFRPGRPSEKNNPAVILLIIYRPSQDGHHCHDLLHLPSRPDIPPLFSIEKDPSHPDYKHLVHLREHGSEGDGKVKNS